MSSYVGAVWQMSQKVFSKLVFWNAKSKWDYFAVIAVLQWYSFFVAFLFLALQFFIVELRIVYAGFFLVTLGLNTVVWSVVFATVFGSKHHPQMEPGILYHLAAFFFGPVVGVHYLLRTSNPAEDTEPPTGSVARTDSSATR